MSKSDPTKRSPGVSRRRFLTAASAAATLTGVSQAITQEASPVAKARPIVLDSVDVLVVGGGTAGIGAALGAARQGARTLLIENHSFFGGVAAWSMGMQMNQMRLNGEPRSNVHELVIQKLKAYGEQAVRLGEHQVWSHVEYLKVALLDALDEVGCRYLVHVRAVDTTVENNRVAGVVIATKQGLRTILAQVVVDCTGDADVSFYAGAETMLDPAALMPMTLGFTLNNIGQSKIGPEDVRKAIQGARGRFPLITAGFLEINQVARTNSWYVNHAGTADLGRVDGTDPGQRTKAECFSRRQVLQMIKAIRESSDPVLQQIEWGGAGPQVSVRETRRVKGLYVITEEDAMAGRTFDDAVAVRSGYLDLGGQKGGKFIKMRIHDVPYRAIVPEKLDGLLVAGRCISATHVGAAAGKSMGNCMATGHAAGFAAALSIKQKCRPRELKVAALRDALRADGVSFDIEGRDQQKL